MLSLLWDLGRLAFIMAVIAVSPIVVYGILGAIIAMVV